MPDDLSPSQAAARIGTTTRSVQRWIVTGRLPARRIGGRWRVAFDAIDAFVAPAIDSSGGPAGDPIPAPAPIRTLFVANRGEIAARIARTCDRLGIRAVVPATDGTGALDLLDQETVVAAAVAAGADAVHPGFGFLAENADFATAVEAAGLHWVGPPPSAIRAMGDKAAARRLAASLGVPVLAGYDGADQSDAALIAAAERIGFPILVKPSAGGGGKGMRTVRQPDRLTDALAAARREATGAFGDDRLILERLIEGGRHVEIQVMFDAYGTGIHLGERDCSIQRRHQKVLEESPSPAVGPELRGRLGEAALTLARAVGYVSAGTCEFLVDAGGGPAFLEMNTRLQVEHPVTELVTGRDLVADQIHIAAGARLVVDDPATRPGGHAVEVRLYAEDPEAGFLPATGRIEALRWPGGHGIRVDAGIEVGDAVGGRFDPMLAKIIASGPDRAAALERLAAALDATVVLGIVTNLRFLRWLVRQPVVLDGDARTDTLDRIWPPDDWATRTAIPDTAWGSAAAALTGSHAATLTGPDTATDISTPIDPWSGGWRLNAAPSARIEADGVTRTVSIARAAASGSTGAAPALEGDATALSVRVGRVVHIDLAGRSMAFSLASPPDVDAAARAAASRHVVDGAAGPVDLHSPMPGAILSVDALAGQALEVGDPVVTVEAMKMEHVVASPIAGRLVEVFVRPADQVTRGQLVATVEP